MGECTFLLKNGRKSVIQENQNYCEYENYCRWLNIGNRQPKLKAWSLLVYLFHGCWFVDFAWFVPIVLIVVFVVFCPFEYYFLVVFVLVCCFCLTQRCAVPCALVRKPIFRRNRQTILAIRDVIFVEDYRAVLYACVEKETPGGFKTQLISWLIFQNDFKSRFGGIGVEIIEQKKTNERHGAMVDE